jgi:hypothetical protein
MADPTAPPTTSPLPWWALPGLAVIILTIYAGGLVAVCFLNNDTLRTSYFGSVPVVVMTAINYFFGSSAGSDKKSDTIAVDSAAKSAALAVSTPTVIPTTEPSDAAKALAEKLPA